MAEKPLKKLGSKAMLLLVVSMQIFISSCSTEDSSLSYLDTKLATVLFQDFEIPKFPTPSEQLNYAKSGFADPKEKKAALEAVAGIFPDARLQCGQAALTLAYLKLGFNYRFADEGQCRQAVAAYQDVIINFSDMPEVLVKAYWYLGWIHCDLLGQKQVGLEFYRHIVKTYSDLFLDISSPVPWISLVYPLNDIDDAKMDGESRKTWAGLALLEIIHHSKSTDEIWSAFETLWLNYKRNYATGLALNHLLKDPSFKAKAVSYAKNFLELNIANAYLAKEINKNAGG
ncbi:MAG: hypothetical protein GY729_07890 [Desulfobacteraceae bacterium]|nr:hypothetical protein [Desulfobacteraceae bacterium]